MAGMNQKFIFCAGAANGNQPAPYQRRCSMHQKSRTRLLLPLICIALAASPAWSHPGPGILVNGTGRVYFVDGVRHRIMRIDADGKLATFVQGEDGKTLSLPHHLVMDDAGNLYSVGDRDSTVWRFRPMRN